MCRQQYYINISGCQNNHKLKLIIGVILLHKKEQIALGHAGRNVICNTWELLLSFFSFVEWDITGAFYLVLGIRLKERNR